MSNDVFGMSSLTQKGKGMGLADLFKKKTTKEKIAARQTNYAGERMDRLDKDGKLPFGWVVHNQKYVDMIEKELKRYRKDISTASEDIVKWAALTLYLQYLKKGQERYNKMGECVGKYFEEYVCCSYETQQYIKAYEELDKKLKENSHL